MSQAYSKLVTPLQQSQRDPPATDPGHHDCKARTRWCWRSGRSKTVIEEVGKVSFD